MNLIEVNGDNYVFRVGKRARTLLSEVLRQYPLVPAGYHRLSRSDECGGKPANQALLDEVMAAQRSEYRQQLDRFLNDPQRFAADTASYRLTLSREEMEWLLQILNDVRVGSWIKLGCPDPATGTALSSATDPCLLTMELAAHFQCVLLEAL